MKGPKKYMLSIIGAEEVQNVNKEGARKVYVVK